ncbi:GNAT family N-acetyltransferase [Streptomyces spongiae]|uniref:GNAT family N-acetyltransferase n=1 Tax=Streptomyces spongiae TaxID=565072 RepID=A0A5N8X9L6_9ACTN|nr:GNAT family N-acetyltransferase [Streptomyces spongiae]MPY55824.1 GNAT family N-acetyltransferase [Streptomyces spongiae]
MSLTRIDGLSDPRWVQLWSQDALQHAHYTSTGLGVGAHHYTRAYYLSEDHDVNQPRDSASEFLPRHAVVLGSSGPVAGVALTVELLDDRTRLSAYGRPVILVEDRSQPARVRKQAAELLYKHIEAVREEHGAERWHARDTLLDGMPSPLTEAMLRNGGVSRHHLVRMVDLEADDETLRLDLRKSYRYIIKKRPEGLELKVLSAADITRSDLEQFAKLEYASYRQNLVSNAVWDAILTSIQKGEGFLVTAFLDGEPVSMGYFTASARHVVYVAGVNDQDKAGVGLTHHVVWQAIQYARSVGCAHFELGELIHPGDHPGLNDKLRSISHFKDGFGNKSVCRLDVFSAPLEEDS